MQFSYLSSKQTKLISSAFVLCCALSACSSEETSTQEGVSANMPAETATVSEQNAASMINNSEMVETAKEQVEEVMAQAEVMAAEKIEEATQAVDELKEEATEEATEKAQEELNSRLGNLLN